MTTAICGLCVRRERANGLDAMLAALPGRETDVLRKWTGESAAFGWRGRGHRTDGEAGRLPRFDATAGLAIVASARLDGRGGLCDSLGVPRRDREGLTDGELILRSYARWGPACPEHLLGDYAFALWDANRRVLFCARDHIGVRPFYYALAGERFAFASDIDSILAASVVSGELDKSAVATRLTYGARPLGERTFYRGVRRLLPGHALRVERGALRVERWWRAEELPATPATSDDAIAEAVLAACDEAVRDRLRDDRSFGVHLSGGLDSSSVAVLAAREMRRRGQAPPPAFAWQPPPGPGPRGPQEEAEYGTIEAVCRAEGLRPFYCAPRPRDVIAFLRRGVPGEGEASLIQEEAVQRAAAGQCVEVLLSGWGGDECVTFNGRGYYPQLLRAGRFRRLWRELKERSAHPFAMLLTEATLPLVSLRAYRIAAQLRRRQWPFRKKIAFIHPAFARRTRLLPPVTRQPAAGVRDMQLYLLQHGHLNQRMEGWAARGAALGIEYRYPLLDRRLLELVLGLPPDQFRRGCWSRWVMRRAMAPVLPHEVCWTAKGTDPVRMGALTLAVEKALPAVRGMILAHSEPPSRSRYLDLPRLMEQAHPVRWRASGRHSPVLNALRFLDF